MLLILKIAMEHDTTAIFVYHVSVSNHITGD